MRKGHIRAMRCATVEDSRLASANWVSFNRRRRLDTWEFIKDQPPWLGSNLHPREKGSRTHSDEKLQSLQALEF